MLRSESTFCHKFVNIVDELESEDDIVPDNKVNSHAVDATFFDGEFSHLLGIVIFEFEENIAFGSVWTD
jgi:hypothetical protein